MKIKEIRISNILSFRHFDDIHKAEGMEFKLSATSSDLHICIGPNGSGKSNFVEILNQVFRKSLFRKWNFNEEQYGRVKDSTLRDEKKSVLTRENETHNNLNKHHAYQDKPRVIYLELWLSNEDISNIKTINQQSERLKQILSDFSSAPPALPTFTSKVLEEIEESQNRSVKFLLQDDEQSRLQLRFVGDNYSEEGFQNFIKGYLEDFGLYKAAMQIFNKEKPKADPAITTLQDSFALIGCYRNYNDFGSGVIIQGNKSDQFKDSIQKIWNETTRQVNNQQPPIFEYVKRQVGYRFIDLYHENTHEDAKSSILLDSVVLEINKLLTKHLGFRLRIHKPNPYGNEINFDLIRGSDSASVRIDDLSAGQKNILHFVFSIYGYEIRNGLFIIDEPELHLHPELQKSYLSVLKDAAQHSGNQFIVVTHSPSFVDHTTINCVARFYLRDKGTKIIVSRGQDHDVKDLIRILDYTNSSSIFFVDKIILCEGDTDESYIPHSDCVSLFL